MARMVLKRLNIKSITVTNNNKAKKNTKHIKRTIQIIKNYESL